MKILISSISFCEYVIQQANGLAGIGHAVLLFMPAPLVDGTVGEDIEKYLASNVQYYAYDVVERRHRSFYAKLFQTVSTFSPDLLHVHENGELETLALILRYHHAALVVTVHDVATHSGTDSQIKMRRRLIKKLLRRRANVIHLHGERLREELKRISPKLASKSRVIPHGTLSLFKQWECENIAREPLTCLFFGRMEKYRGLDNLLKIGRILKETLPDIRIVVAGRGTELANYNAEMKALGVFEIHDAFIPDKDVHRFFRRASLLLLPYHEASQSGVVLMGLPFGVPVVATAVGSIPDILEDGQHGRIVPVGDLDSFSDAVVELLGDEDRHFQMRTACRELGDSLSFTCLAKDFDALYAYATAVKR